jgi:hypothetical protein
MLTTLLLVLTLAQDNPLFPVKQTPGKPASAAAMLGEQAVKLLGEPGQVMLYRVDGENNARFDVPNVEGFRILVEKPLDAARIPEIRDLLLDDKAYDFTQWGNDKWCGFVPGIAVVFQRDKASVVALVCFKCGDIVFTASDEKGERFFSTYADFSPSRARWLKLAREWFPHDEALKALE